MSCYNLLHQELLHLIRPRVVTPYYTKSCCTFTPGVATPYYTRSCYTLIHQELLHLITPRVVTPYYTKSCYIVCTCFQFDISLSTQIYTFLFAFTHFYLLSKKQICLILVLDLYHSIAKYEMVVSQHFNLGHSVTVVVFQFFL